MPEFETAILVVALGIVLLYTLPNMYHAALLDTYVQALDSRHWTEDEDLYEQLLVQYPKLKLNQHNQIIADLLLQKRIERKVFHPQQVIREVEAPNHLGRTHIDRIQTFSTISVTGYRRARGGKKHPHTHFMSFRFDLT